MTQKLDGRGLLSLVGRKLADHVRGAGTLDAGGLVDVAGAVAAELDTIESGRRAGDDAIEVEAEVLDVDTRDEPTEPGA